MPENFQLLKYNKLPKLKAGQEIFQLAIKDLYPTQMCIGLAEVIHRRQDFSKENINQRLKYLRSKPIPIVCDKKDHFWMLDRHHRLRALLELDTEAKAYGYIVARTNTVNTSNTLEFLSSQGWLYLYDSKGRGPKPHSSLPRNLLEMEDDSYRSLVWLLKKEGLISPSPQTPYHEFRWGNWLRTRCLPPFNSNNLHPAISIARKLVCSNNASHLTGWKGQRD